MVHTETPVALAPLANSIASSSSAEKLTRKDNNQRLQRGEPTVAGSRKRVLVPVEARLFSLTSLFIELMDRSWCKRLWLMTHSWLQQLSLQQRALGSTSPLALRTLVRRAPLLGMRGFPAKVVTEADGHRLGYINSQRVHGVAEPRFEERIAGL